MNSVPSASDLGSLALQLALIGCQAGIGLAIVRWLFADWEPAERWAVGGLAAISISSTLALACGVVGLFSPTAVLLATATTSIGLLQLARRSGSGPGERSDRVRRGSAVRGLGILVLLTCTPVALRSVLEVPLDWDGLTYHLYLPVRWLQEGRIRTVALPPPLHAVGNMPMSADLFRFLTAIVVRNDLLVKVVNLPVLALGAASLYAFGRRCALELSAARAVALLWVTLPAVISWGASTYVEPMLDFAILVAAMLLARLVQVEKVTVEGIALGLAGGLAIGSKLVGLHYLAVIATLALLLSVSRGRFTRSRLAVVVWTLSLSCAVGGYWYFRNALVFGNPFYPRPFLWLAGLEDPLLPWDSSLLNWSVLRQLARHLSSAWFSSPLEEISGLSLGWVAAVVLPLAVLGGLDSVSRAARSLRAGDRRAAALDLLPTALLAASTVSYLSLPLFGQAFWLYTNVRFAAPAAAFGLVVAAGFVARRISSSRVWDGIALGGIAVNSLFLDWRLPTLSAPLVGWLVWLALLGAAWALGTRALRRAALPLALTALVLLPWSWSWREAMRYSQYAWLWEGHVSEHVLFGGAARRVAEEPSSRTLALAGTDRVEFYYLFVGPRMDRRVLAAAELAECVPSPGATVVDDSAWRDCLLGEGVDLLLVSRWRAPGWRWPIEDELAARQGLDVLLEEPLLSLFDLGREATIESRQDREP